MRTREARLLAEWSARRIGYSIRFWTKYLRLVVDWTVALYIVIPGLALLTYSVVQYYRGAWTKGLSPATIILPHIPLAVLVDGLLLILLFLYHLVSYGGVTWPLNSGDRLFLLLSPVRRWSVLTTLWGKISVYAWLGLPLSGWWEPPSCGCSGFRRFGGSR
ncbi:hypothetical protein GCM10025857_35800 [Alicyclobacillus contaminans]|nr:hypothetical protein GCM10025857_35800 [Alicyclobacillus contaminans]